MHLPLNTLGVGLLMGLAGQSAFGDQWGCTVLLCLSNPAGPTAVEACKPPIHRLWDHLRDGNDFPTCDMAKGGRSSAYAKLGFNFFDPCPPGTNPLAQCERAIQATARGGMRAVWKRTSVSDMFTGIGDGEGYSFSDRYGRPLPLVCVGSKIGTTSVSPDGRSWFSVSVYDRVTTLRPQASPRIIDVFMNGTWYRRVRW